MKKLLLILLYPIALFINKDLRRFETNRLKYWASDHDYFKKEFEGLLVLSLLAFVFYFSFGLSTFYLLSVGTLQKIEDNFSETVYKHHVSKQHNKTLVDSNIILEKEKIVISEEEYEKHLNHKETNIKKDISDIDDDMEALLKKQRDKNKE